MSHRLIDDFNGDGRSDILLRHFTGVMQFWDGTQAGGFSAGITIPINRSAIFFSGDFNGDHREDILSFYYDNNGNAVLLSQLQTISAGFQPDFSDGRVLPPDWSIVSVADFNNDGKADVLLRNIDGTVTDWLIGPPDETIVDVPNAPFSALTGNFMVHPGPDWHVAATGDFNGDGLTDILWRHDSGLVSDWLGSAAGGLVPNGQNSEYNPGPTWHVIGTGDFNGDGRSDILWRHDSGTISESLGLPNGGFSDNSANVLVNPGQEWQVKAIGDYNGDGRDDILWEHTTGLISTWLGRPDGGFIENPAQSFTPAVDWIVEDRSVFDMW